MFKDKWVIVWKVSAYRTPKLIPRINLGLFSDLRITIARFIPSSQNRALVNCCSNKLGKSNMWLGLQELNVRQFVYMNICGSHDQRTNSNNCWSLDTYHHGTRAVGTVCWLQPETCHIHRWMKRVESDSDVHCRRYQSAACCHVADESLSRFLILHTSAPWHLLHTTRHCLN